MIKPPRRAGAVEPRVTDCTSKSSQSLTPRLNSYEDLAAHMGRHGLTRHESFYAKIETGGTRIKLNEAVTIAGALGLSLSQMTTDVDQDKLTRELAQATNEVLQAQAQLDNAQNSAHMAAMNYHRAVERRNDLLAILESAGRKPDPDGRRP